MDCPLDNIQAPESEEKVNTGVMVRRYSDAPSERNSGSKDRNTLKDMQRSSTSNLMSSVKPWASNIRVCAGGQVESQKELCADWHSGKPLSSVTARLASSRLHSRNGSPCSKGLSTPLHLHNQTLQRSCCCCPHFGNVVGGLYAQGDSVVGPGLTLKSGAKAHNLA